MRLQQVLAAGIAAILATGCTERGDGSIAAPNSSRYAGANSQVEASAREVARAFGMAMSRPDVRTSVRDAMRSSEVTEHKLVLQDFIHTHAGRRLVRAAAEAVGRPPSEIEALIAGLPEMDFYAPFREHRMNWRGTADVVVGVTLEIDEPSLWAYGTQGEPVYFATLSTAPARALLVLHPAERKSRRIRAQRAVPGEVIQDADDGELSGSYVWRDRYGRIREVDLADLDDGTVTLQSEELCYETCSSDGSGSTSSDTTFVNYLQVSYSDAIGFSEVELHSKFVKNGVAETWPKLRYEGVQRNEVYEEKRVLMYREMTADNTAMIPIQVIETDAFNSDEKGSRDFFYPDRDEIRSIFNGGETTNIRLTWTP